jgi:hypothetical protein
LVKGDKTNEKQDLASRHSPNTSNNPPNYTNKILANTSGLSLQIISPNQQNISLTSDDILTLPKTTVYAELSLL